MYKGGWKVKPKEKGYENEENGATGQTTIGTSCLPKKRSQNPEIKGALETVQGRLKGRKE